MEETLAYVLGSLSIVLVGFFSLADGALSEFSWLKLEDRLGDKTRRRWFSDHERGISISVKVLSVVFNAGYATAVLYIAASTHPEGGWVVLSVAGAILLGGLAFADMVPDLLGRRNPESVLALLLPLLWIVEFILRPLNALLEWVTEIFARILGFPKDETSAEQISEEIMSAITEGKHEGVFKDGEERMMKSIIEFKDVQIAEIMTPRTGMFAIQADTSLDEAARVGFEKGHSRIPVYGENLDDVCGILYMKDLLGNWPEREAGGKHVRDLSRKAYFVPETKRVGELLLELRRDKIHIAVVMDEYGGTAGIITIEDIIEEIVGEIEDEFDPAAPDPIKRIDDSTAMVDAQVHVDELNESFGIAIPEDESYETVSGFLFSQTGKIPEIGETVEFENVTFTILDADERSIKRVKVVKTETEND